MNYEHFQFQIGGLFTNENWAYVYTIIIIILINKITKNPQCKQFIKENLICIPITFNNPFKVCFSNKKCTITTQTRLTQIIKVYFLLKNQVLTDF